MKTGRVRIAKFQSKHLKECTDIMAGSDPWVTFGVTHTDARAFFECHLSSDRCYVAIQDGKVVGFIVFYAKDAFPLGGYVKAIAVEVRHRKQGTGKKMMEFAEARILKQWPNVFLLVSDFNMKARRFYRKLGYSQIGRIPNALAKGRAELIYRKITGRCKRFPTQFT